MKRAPGSGEPLTFSRDDIASVYWGEINEKSRRVFLKYGPLPFYSGMTDDGMNIHELYWGLLNENDIETMQSAVTKFDA